MIPKTNTLIQILLANLLLLPLSHLVFCHEDIDECAIRPHVCKNGATCIDREGGYQCTCVNGWTGHDCSINVDDCANAACGHGATCHDRVGHFYCECPPGRIGLLCHLEDGCASNPCHPNAICDASPLDGHATCTCPAGYTGADCSTDIDECAITGSPCEHGGSCINTAGSFRCECPRGFNGSRCEININECENNPCRNEGSCLDEEGGYRCICMSGFTGNQCEIDVNECAPNNPCLNGGICQDLHNSFKCICPIGHWGVRCEFTKICENYLYCVDHFHDGKCDQECNNVECGWDNFDCETSFGNNEIQGVLVVKFKPSLSSYGDKANANKHLAKILRSLSSALPGTVFRVRSSKEVDDGQSTELELVGDNRKCENSCNNDPKEWVEILNQNTNSTGPINLALGANVEFSARNNENRVVYNILAAVAVVGSIIGLMIYMSMNVVSYGNDPKKVRSTVWYPEGFLGNLKSVKVEPNNKSSNKIGVGTLQALSGNFFRGNKRNEKRINTNSNTDTTNINQQQELPKRLPPTPNANTDHYYEICHTNETEVGPNLITQQQQQQHHHHHHHHNVPPTPPNLHMAPVDLEGPHGHTPLMVASMRPDFTKEPFELVKYGTTGDISGQSAVTDLLQRGAQVNIRNKLTGETALHLAARYGRADHTRQLLERGADVNAQDATGRTPIHASIAADSRGVFELLANSRSVDINAQTSDGTTPLILALRSGTTDYFVDQLIVYECDINKCDANGKTALHWAAATNNVYAIKKLLVNCANKDTQDLAEETPLFLSAREGAKGAVEILLAHNANKEICDNMQRSPVDIARSRGHLDIVHLLEEHEPATPKSLASVQGYNCNTVISTEVYNVPCLKNFMTPSPESLSSVEGVASPPDAYLEKQYHNRNHPCLSNQKPNGVFI